MNRKRTYFDMFNPKKLFVKTRKDMKRINLIGWYGEGAVGDDLIGFCIENVLLEEAKHRGIRMEFTQSNKCDLVVVGGGSILGCDSMGLYDRLKSIKAPLVFFGGGFRREQRDIGKDNRKHMKKLIDRAFLKGVRGYVSQQMFVHNDIYGVEVIGDPALLFEPIPVDDFAGEFKVGVAVRNMGKTGESHYLSNEKTHKIFAEICDYFVEDFNAQLYFFPAAENIHDSDLEGAEKTIELMRNKQRAQIVPFIKDPLVFGSMIGKMDYLVSQRLHPTLLAWVQGIPCIAFEYHYNKTVDFMNSIGMDEFVIRTDEFTLDFYKKKLDRLFREKELIMTHARKSINYWRDEQRDFAGRCLDIVTQRQEGIELAGKGGVR